MSDRFCLALGTLAAPGVAQATGGEMTPFVLGIFLPGLLAAFFLQFLTLLLEATLPRSWPRYRRWVLAILVAPLLTALLSLAAWTAVTAL